MSSEAVGIQSGCSNQTRPRQQQLQESSVAVVDLVMIMTASISSWISAGGLLRERSSVKKN